MKIATKKLFLSSVVCAILFGFVSLMQVNAYNIFGSNVKFTNGIYDKKYYITSSFSNYSSNWTDRARDAFSAWNFTPTRFYINETSSISNSIVDCYMETLTGEYWSGLTEYYVTNQGWVNPTSQYSYTKFTLNYFQLLGLSNDVIKSVIAHEIGHTVGLDHSNSNPNVIMCQLGYGRTALSPKQDDCNGVDFLYGVY